MEECSWRGERGKVWEKNNLAVVSDNSVKRGGGELGKDATPNVERVERTVEMDEYVGFGYHATYTGSSDERRVEMVYR
jgi:hypothetical protein